MARYFIGNVYNDWGSNVNTQSLEARQKGMKIVVVSSVDGYKKVKSRHSSGKKLTDIADVVIDSCVPAQDASVSLKNHQDKIGPVSTIAFVTVVWLVITSVAEKLIDRGVKLHIHPSHNVPGDTTARERLDDALAEYKRRITGV